MKIENILSLEIIAALRETAPVVTVPSYEFARITLKALNMYAAGNKPEKDAKGIVCWSTGFSGILSLMTEFSPSEKQLGTMLRAFQMTMKRENNGYHVAFSQKQLDILNANIK